MFNGAHVVIYSRDAEADRCFLRDVIGLPHVDVGGGRLIFALPPAEVAFHPTDKPGPHQLYLMCDDVEVCRKALQAKGVPVSGVTDEGWSLLASLTLPGGGTLGYQPRHARPPHE